MLRRFFNFINILFNFFLFSLDLERRDKDGHVVLWFAILSSKVNLEDDPDSNYAAKLVKRGSSADAVNPLSGTEPIFIKYCVLRFLELLVVYYQETLRRRQHTLL